jgi:hypothetical protein
MKLREILNESPEDTVARFYKEASADFDKFHNLEDTKYKDKNKKYYDDHFKQWFAEEITPVFTKPVDKQTVLYSNKPEGSKLQSPGYRGLQYALHNAGLPYNKNVQKYHSNSSAIISAERDGARNDNS